MRFFFICRFKYAHAELVSEETKKSQGTEARFKAVLSFAGDYQRNLFITILASSSVVLTAAYTIWTYNREQITKEGLKRIGGRLTDSADNFQKV
jgi:hypothetical protein